MPVDYGTIAARATADGLAASTASAAHCGKNGSPGDRGEPPTVLYRAMLAQGKHMENAREI
jgi:hypothetical protein